MRKGELRDERPRRLQLVQLHWSKASSLAVDSDKIEIWFQDVARIGQKNKITRRWAEARHPPKRAP
jgi:hypothetical protein